MLVYRVQTPCGGGLYRKSDYANAVLHDTGTRHPMPYADDALMRALEKTGDSYPGKLFAFSSIAQLKFWIYREEDRRAIAAEGLQVYVFDVERAWVGDTQCVFERTAATLLDRLCLTEI